MAALGLKESVGSVLMAIIYFRLEDRECFVSDFSHSETILGHLLSLQSVVYSISRNVGAVSLVGE